MACLSSEIKCGGGGGYIFARGGGAHCGAREDQIAPWLDDCGVADDRLAEACAQKLHFEVCCGDRLHFAKEACASKDHRSIGEGGERLSRKHITHAGQIWGDGHFQRGPSRADRGDRKIKRANPWGETLIKNGLGVFGCQAHADLVSV
jgi:hypothetical protein